MQRVINIARSWWVDLGISADGSRIVFSTYASQLEPIRMIPKMYIASIHFTPTENYYGDKLLKQKLVWLTV